MQIQNRSLNVDFSIELQILLFQSNFPQMRQIIYLYSSSTIIFFFYQDGVHRMANKHYSIDQLQTLLQDTSEELQNTLLDFTNRNSQYFYQNFTNLSLKAIKYINHFLNLVNTNQTFGMIIDDILKTLTQSLKQYKSRNVFVQSNYSFETENNRDEDQIYHFMNTRNTLLPLQCLNNYQNEKQRIELEEFVKEMEKNTKYTHPKQSKRSLILPKENSFTFKLGRKATYDVELKPIKEQVVENNFAIVINQAPKFSDNVQIQTCEHELIEVLPKKQEIQAVSQCDNVSIVEPGLSTISNINTNKNKSHPNIKKNGGKSKKKNNDQNQSKFKKAKASPSKLMSSKDSFFPSSRQLMQNLKEKQMFELSKQKNLQSMMTVKINSPILAICNRQIDIIVENWELSNGNTTNNITPAASRKKLMTKIFAELAKSSRKFDTQTMAKDQAQKQNLSNLKDNSILDKLIGQQQSIQLEKNHQTLSKLRNEAIIQGTSSEEANKQGILSNEDPEKKNNHTPYGDQSARKIPISSLKINENAELQQNQEGNTKSHVQHSPSNALNKGKRSTLTSLKQGFKSFNSSVQNEGSDMSKHLRTSKINIQAHADKNKLKKQSYRSYNKSSSFATVNGGESYYESIQSQDYLASRQRPTDQAQLINRLAEIQQKKQVNHKNQFKIEENASKPNQMKPKKTSQQNIRIRHSKEFEGQSIDGNLMVVFSNKNRVGHQKNSLFKPQCVKSMECSSKNLETNKNIEQMKQGIQTRQQSLSSKQRQLSTIVQANKHEQSAIDQSKLALLRYSRNNQCHTVDINASRPNKTLYRQSSEVSPIKASVMNIQNALLKRNKKLAHSSSQHTISLQNYEMSEFKRKLRNRANKDKLNQYLGLIESTHKRFCGEQCPHIAELFQGQQGDISQQIFRLYKRLK